EYSRKRRQAHQVLANFFCAPRSMSHGAAVSLGMFRKSPFLAEKDRGFPPFRPSARPFRVNFFCEREPQALSWAVILDLSSLPSAYVLRRIGYRLATPAQSRRSHGGSKALGKVFPAPGAPGPDKAAAHAAPRSRRRRRCLECLEKFLS